MDIKGANVFLEHLKGQTPKKAHHHHHTIKANRLSQQPVESILVCTGVYNPQNDLLFHVRKLFSHKSPKPVELKSTPESREVATSCSEDSHANGRVLAQDEGLIEQPIEPSEELDESDLSQAFSNKNSFISYFDDEFNLPDHTFDNLRHSVDFILKESGL